MRNQFAKTVTELAGENKKIVLLSGDIGNRLFNDYKKVAENRFFNCGIAEANMISMAAGLAHSGMQPVAYTITPFITTRCLEQIKVDVCYHNLPVILVGTGSGLSYAELGATHHSCEDIAIMRALPNMHVICAADRTEVRMALRKAVELKKPVYLRIGKKNEPDLYKQDPDFIIGKGISLVDGDDICLLATGNMVSSALELKERLSELNISAKVVSFHTIKPLDEKMLKESFTRYRLVVTLEEHNLIGGFGSAVAEWSADQHHQYSMATLLRLGTPDQFIKNVKSQAMARAKYDLGIDEMVIKIESLYRRILE